VIVPPARSRYLAEIADTVRGYHKHAASKWCWRANVSSCTKAAAWAEAGARSQAEQRGWKSRLRENDTFELNQLPATEAKSLLISWPDMQQAYSGDEYVVKIRDKKSAPA
jgi:methylmalonyl-CoA mutase